MKEKQRVYIESSWITGDTCLFRVTNVVDHAVAKRKVGEMRRAFVKRLIDDGYLITEDKENLTDDDVCLIMNDIAIQTEENTIEAFKKEFDKRIITAGGNKLYYPKSVSIEEFFEKPFFPAVLKNESTNGGKDKFLIENQEQLEIIKRFYYSHKEILEYKNIFNMSIFQQYIQTPTNYKTYIRVLMSASGDVMGASLKYSKGVVENKKIEGVLEKEFLNPNSEYFLNCKTMFGYYSGGENISFSQPRYSAIKQEILEAHKINPICPTVPKDVEEATRNIMLSCNRELGIMAGFDYIYNVLDGKWYYLECQAFPAIEEWAATKNIKVPTQRNLNAYIEYLKIELETRYDALKLYMENKYSFKDDEEKNEVKSHD